MSGRRDFGLIRSDVERHGHCRVRLSADVSKDLRQLSYLLRDIGEPLHVYLKHPFWKPLVVDLDRPPARSGGTGLNSLHIDCVNAELPPDFVVLYCVRSDPHGGGANILSRLDGLERELTESTLSTLRRSTFREGHLVDLAGVGKDSNPFHVLNERGWRWRYTGRLLEGVTDDATLDALLEVDRLTMFRSFTVDLRSGDALIIDQRQMLHGRLPLGKGQSALSSAHRRTIVQAYGRRLEPNRHADLGQCREALELPQRRAVAAV